ncbi:MAG: allantoicase [Candidatus Acidiferrales bacterium]
MSDFTHLVDIASERLGGRVIVANDEFFAPKENVLKFSKPIFVDGKYTSRGKWMDGWETRRRRTPGYDWCIIRLGLPGVIHGVIVDTSFFRGNYPERCSLEACDLGTPPYRDERTRLNSAAPWHELLPETALKGDSQNSFSLANSSRFTHVRLRIYPDGGVARLRIHGEVVPNVERIGRVELDLAGVVNGGRAIASSDRFYGEPLNLLMPGRGKNMSDGWETRRRRGPGHDWVIVKLGISGAITAIEVDTSHFKGNFPESCSVEACHTERNISEKSFLQSAAWKQALPRTKLLANRRHIFRNQIQDAGVATHVRLNIFPDGGVSRLRIFGRPANRNARASNIARLNELSDVKARQTLLDCCGSSAWAQRVLAKRPFSTADELLQTADSVWVNLGGEEWLAAFRYHPAMGSKKAGTKRSGTARRWSANEQSAALKGTPETMAALTAGNRAYKTKFGYVFLICATGKTSREILAALQQRISNDAGAELRIAAEEQRKITQLRLQKLLGS